MKVVCIIQARMNSTRLPGKVLLPVTPHINILKYMVDRIERANNIDQIVIATTASSFLIHSFCDENSIDYFIGSENNVMSRVISCANKYKADIIVDLTSDCPFVDPKHIDHLVDMLLDDDNGFRYASNIDPRSWPDGFDIQCYYTHLLDFVYPSVEKKYLQHTGWNILNSYIPWRHHWKYNLLAPDECNFPKMRLTLDYNEDYKTIVNIIKAMSDEENYGLQSAEEIIQFALSHPELIENKHLESKEPGE